MTNNDLLKQLNGLKDIKPGPVWKKTNREILVSQIFGPQTPETRLEFSWAKIMFERLPLQVMRGVSRPAMIGLCIIFFLVGGGVLSMQASRDTKPGDSLYIAKIMSEKAQFALTFDEREKARLGIYFAGNRARELDRVLSQADDGIYNKEEAAKKLVSDFRKEIDGVKTRLAKISPETKKPAAKKEAVPAEEGAEAEEPATKEEGAPVFSAALEKDERGIELSEPVKETQAPAEAEKTGGDAAAALSEPVAATTSEETKIGDPQTILNQAELLLDNDDYDGMLLKLDEAGEAISQVNAGQTEGMPEEVIVESAATSTEPESENNGESNTNIADEEEETSPTDQ